MGECKNRAREWYGGRENGRHELGSGTGEERLEDTSTGVATGEGRLEDMSIGEARGKGEWKTRAREWHGGREWKT